MADHTSGPPAVAGDEVPVSAGIPSGVRVALLLGVALIISIMGMTIAASSFGHVWPSAESLHIQL